MSNSDSVFPGFFNKLKSGGTLSIFLIFLLGLLLVFVVFFLVLDYSHSKTMSTIDSKVSLQQELSSQVFALEKEVLDVYTTALQFNLSHEELMRIETVYALKNTKKIFDELLKSASMAYLEDLQLDSFEQLKKKLSNFTSHIAEFVNNDGKLNELIDASMQSSDSIKSTFFIDDTDIGTGTISIKLLDNDVEAIKDELIMLESRISTIIQQDLSDVKRSPLNLYVVFTIIIIALVLILYVLISKIQGASMAKLNSVLYSISKGELPEEALKNIDHQDGITETSNELVLYLDDASQFARKIGDGDFDYEFKPKSEKDELGNSLIDMRSRLQEVAREDKIRNWVNEGQARFGEILRLFNDDIEALGNKIIVEIVEYLGANQAALFVLKEDESYLELLAAYANKRKKYIEKKIEIGEGLAGQAFEEGKSIYMTDITSDHYNIQTGLGESVPSSLLIVPLKQKDRIAGVLEIASLKELKKYQIEFVESIGESIASSLSAGEANLTTKKLLEETQAKAEQMRAQEEELRQNMEELAATQEQMAQRNKEMEEVQLLLSEERYLLNALLNSTHDRIYFKDRDSKFIRVSKSMIGLFGKRDENEIIGKSDFDFGFEEHAKIAFEDEQRIIRTGQPLIDAIEKEQWDNGRVSWVSTTKNPLKDLDGKIVGTFGISRDITEKKEADLEMINRKEWFEKFFKFHTIGYVVLNQEGKVSFATKSLLSQIGKENAENLIYDDLFVDKSFDEFLREIDFDHNIDTEVEMSLKLNNRSKTDIYLSVISGRNDIEDGIRNIFLIQK